MGEESVYIHLDTNIEAVAQVFDEIQGELLKFLQIDLDSVPVNLKIEIFPGSVVLRIILTSDQKELAQEKANEVVGYYASSRLKTLDNFPLAAGSIECSIGGSIECSIDGSIEGSIEYFVKRSMECSVQ